MRRRSFLSGVISMALAGLFGVYCGRKPKHGSSRVGSAGSTDAEIYRALNGGPDQNMRKVLELMGGVETLFGREDIIVIKPNLQWYNQGAPNIAAVNAFIDELMQRPGGFSGEVVLVENIHYGKHPLRLAGWNTPFARNSDLPGITNFNQLCEQLDKRYGDRFTRTVWLDVDDGGRRVYSPAQGCGYVYCDGTGGTDRLVLENGLSGDEHRGVCMTYPIFQTKRGTVIDFKHGIWANGSYSSQPVRYINMAALNHHSGYCGYTSAVKNYLGVSDLSGGPDPHNRGLLDGKFYNFHSFPFDKWRKGPVPGMLGAEIGMFLATVRAADLNITTAEWVGMASRLDLPAARTQIVLASTDPVALDYHAGKYVLFPNSRIALHDPDNPETPVAHDLEACAQKSGYVLDETRVKVVSYDCRKKRLQENNDLFVHAPIEWGTQPKTLLKYFMFRLGKG